MSSFGAGRLSPRARRALAGSGDGPVDRGGPAAYAKWRFRYTTWKLNEGLESVKSMTPRAPKATDSEIFGAVALATSRIGPDRMTLEEVAREVGVTPSALVQRFGSKRDLMLAAVRHWNEAGEDPIAVLRSRNPSALATLRDYAACVAGGVADPEAMANQLAMLQLDVADPEFRAEAARFFRGERATLRGWLEEAAREGALSPDADRDRLAAAIQVSLAGWRILWSIVREGDAEEAAAEVLETVLGPHLA